MSGSNNAVLALPTQLLQQLLSRGGATAGLKGSGTTSASVAVGAGSAVQGPTGSDRKSLNDAQPQSGKAPKANASESAGPDKKLSGGGQTLTGKVSWYGGPNDKEDNDKPALAGATNKTPGIAVNSRSTLGGWWLVTLWDGRKVKLQQTDIGPAEWTGKKIDFNYTAVKSLGFTEGNFPTGETASAVYLGK